MPHLGLLSVSPSTSQTEQRRGETEVLWGPGRLNPETEGQKKWGR